MRDDLKGKYEIPEARFQDALVLDKYYILTRYPNGFDSGAPADYYTKKEAEAAYEAAQRIIQFCEGQIPGSPTDQGQAGNAGPPGNAAGSEH